MNTVASPLRVWRTELVLGVALTLGLAVAGYLMIRTTAADGAVTIRSIDELRHYVEDVFRKQNRISYALIELETANNVMDEPQWLAISLAEDRMYAACESLNAAALAIVEGRAVGLMLKMKIVISVAGCDRATRGLQVELDLNRISEGSFGYDTIAL